MAVMTDRTAEDAKLVSTKILDQVFRQAAADQIGIQFWDGTLWPDDKPKPVRMILKHPSALRDMLLPGTELALAEAYLYDDFDIEGDIIEVFRIADGISNSTNGFRKKLRVARDLLRLPDSSAMIGTKQKRAHHGPADLSGRKHSVDRDRQAISYHYDVSNNFYQLFLDKRMIYSCAYFHDLDQDLDTAQENKLDHICKKLRLQPGQRVLDIGCGWGGLVIYAAKNYGVDVTGITLSHNQADLANQRIAEAGLSDRCRVILQDYREVPTAEPFDALVSVGMFEHVGQALLPTYFKKAMDLLKPQGVFLNHGIGQRANNVLPSGPNFSDSYVFPDGETVPINVTLHAAEEAGFEVRDVENLREHYAQTLRHWVSRLEFNHDKALQYVEEPTYRVWRLFMSGSSYEFRVGRLNIYQTLLSKMDAQGNSNLPLTRKDWYC